MSGVLLQLRPFFNFFNLNFLMVHVLKIGLIIKSTNYFISFQSGWLNRKHGQIAAPWIFQYVIAKVMMDRIIVDI